MVLNFLFTGILIMIILKMRRLSDNYTRVGKVFMLYSLAVFISPLIKIFPDEIPVF